MSVLDRIRETLGGWMDDTAEAAVAVLSRLSAARTLRIEERAEGDFVLADSGRRSGSPPQTLRIEDGVFVFDGKSGDTKATLRRSDVEIVLRADRFICRPIELPNRAAEFLDGIVRSQVDRLTPWSPAAAAFGYTPPSPLGDGRIALTVVATAKTALMPWLRAATGAGARAVTISTRIDGADAPVTILQESALALDKPRLRRVLALSAVGAALIGAIALAALSFVSDGLQTRQDQLARRIAERRAAMIAARGAATSPAAAAEKALARRKNETPSTVIALEALSRVLPDNTYVTELRVEGDRLRITGLTRDAPALIRLVEQSKFFGRAAFFAPTTRGPNDVADRFHIETRISPVFSGL